jgi:plastocyanin
MHARRVVIPTLLALATSFVSAGPAAASHELVVYLSATGFAPQSRTVALGDRIRFTVRDDKNHQLWKRVGSSSGDVPPNVLEGRGSSVTLAPSEAGAYAYTDRLNPRTPEFRLQVHG